MQDNTQTEVILSLDLKHEELGLLITGINNWICSYQINPNTRLGEKVFKLENRLRKLNDEFNNTKTR